MSIFSAEFNWYSKVALAAVIAVLALAGCRESEQNRPLVYKPGVYGGKPDQKLDQDRLDELRQRGAYQRYF